MSSYSRESSKERAPSPRASGSGVQTRSAAEKKRVFENLHQGLSGTGAGPHAVIGENRMSAPTNLQPSQGAAVTTAQSVSMAVPLPTPVPFPGQVPVAPPLVHQAPPPPVSSDIPPVVPVQSLLEMRRIAAEQVAVSLAAYKPPPLTEGDLDALLVRLMPRVLRSVEDYLVQHAYTPPPVVSELVTSSGLPLNASQISASQGIPRLMPPVRPPQAPPREDFPVNQPDVSYDAARWLALAQQDDAVETPHSSEWKGPACPSLPERKTRRSEFEHVISYRTYRLRNRDTRYNATVADKMADLAKRLKPSMQCPNFSGEDEIAILGFLKNYKTACDDTGTSEGAALPLLRYFLSGGALSSFNSYIGQGLRNATPGVDCIRSYPEAVFWLLSTYATDKVLKEAYKAVTSMKQGVHEDELEFGGRLRQEAIRCGDVFDDGTLIGVFVEGLIPAVGHVMNDLLEENPDMPFQRVKTRAKSRGDAFRAGNSARTSPYVGLSSTHPRSSQRIPRSPRATQSPVMLADVDYHQDYLPETLALPVEMESNSSQSLPGLPSGVNTRPQSTGTSPVIRPTNPGSASGSNSYHRRYASYLCYACKTMGHGLLDCPYLTEEQRRKFREAHQKARALERQPHTGHAGARGNTPPPPGRDSVIQVNPVKAVAFEPPPQASAMFPDTPGPAPVAKDVEGKE